MESFNQTRYKQKLGILVNVSTTAITLSVTPGSVVVYATIVASSSLDAVEIVQTLRSYDEIGLSTALGVQV